jgi:hypothetical protein
MEFTLVLGTSYAIAKLAPAEASNKINTRNNTYGEKPESIY